MVLTYGVLTVAGKLTWLAGLFYEHVEDGWEALDRIDNYEHTQAFAFWNSEYDVQPGTTDNSPVRFHGSQVTDQAAIFGEATYSPNERWSFTAGLRGSWLIRLTRISPR